MTDILPFMAEILSKACQKWQNSYPESGAYLPP